jgi:hypothetical protein
MSVDGIKFRPVEELCPRTAKIRQVASSATTVIRNVIQWNQLHAFESWCRRGRRATGGPLRNAWDDHKLPSDQAGKKLSAPSSMNLTHAY